MKVFVFVKLCKVCLFYGFCQVLSIRRRFSNLSIFANSSMFATSSTFVKLSTFVKGQ